MVKNDKTERRNNISTSHQKLWTSLVVKGVKNSRDKKLAQRNSTEAIIENLPNRNVKYQSVSQSVFNVNLYSKMQIESVLVCTRAKNSTASL